MFGSRFSAFIEHLRQHPILLHHNLQLILFVINKYFQDFANGPRFQDLCQAGVKGLITAIDCFEPKRRFRLSTCSVFWIRHAIIRSMTLSSFTRVSFGLESVDAGLSEEEKLKICCSLNYEKLSAEVCIHLSQNTKFPSKSAVQALISQQYKLKGLLHGTNNSKPYTDSPCTSAEVRSMGKKDEASDQVVIYAGKLDVLSDNEKLKAHLQGMQWRVMELEKICRKMQTQIAKIMKYRISRHAHTRSLPRLCS